MCSISGIIDKNSNSKTSTGILSERLDRMISQLAHRGPDGVGRSIFGPVVLGMTRLSVIGLENGWQPFYSEDKRYCLIANGEVYNYIELRAELIGLGHKFQTDSDCETILNGFVEWGDDVVCRLRGMYAFAIWDSQTETMTFVRDRIGEKPLYIYEDSSHLVFSSEMKGLLASGFVPFEIDPVQVNKYFYYQFVPEPYTPLVGVRKLPSASIAKYSKSTGLTIKSYWDMLDSPETDENPIELIRDKLNDTMDIVLRSDVPVGVALSGGFDSSVIACLMAKRNPAGLSALSVGYSGRPEMDERGDAKQLANKLDIPFYEVEIDTREAVERFEDLNFFRDDPIADVAGFGYYAVNRSARELGIPVMLQGQGGDELFWGYSWFRKSASLMALKAKYQQYGPLGLLQKHEILEVTETTIPENSSIRKRLRKIKGALRALPSIVREINKTHGDRLPFYDLTPDWIDTEAMINQYYAEPQIRKMNNFSEAEAPDFIFRHKMNSSQRENELTKLMINTYLLENGIAQGDRLSMASSVELRLPLVDYTIAEAVMSCRRNEADYRYIPKHWFREACRELVPEFLYRRPKRGFTPPVDEWYRGSNRLYSEQLKGGILEQSGVLSRRGAERCMNEYYTPGTVAPISYKALVFEVWAQQMIKRTNPPTRYVVH